MTDELSKCESQKGTNLWPSSVYTKLWYNVLHYVLRKRASFVGSRLRLMVLESNSHPVQELDVPEIPFKGYKIIKIHLGLHHPFHDNILQL